MNMEKTLAENNAECRALALESLRLRNPNKLLDATPKGEAPSIGEMVVSAGKSLTKWVGSGFSKSTQEVIDLRLSICKGCEFWDAQALNGSGRCLKCGCSTWAKLRMASEKCPLDKWGPETLSSPEQQQQPNTN